MRKPLVSLITVVFNGEKFIAETLESAIAQTYPNKELIVIDGGSKDGTLDVVKKYAQQVSKVVSEPDKGIYDAMNKGVKMATGDWVYFLNVGDRFYDNEVLQDVFDRNTEEYDFLYAKVQTVNEPSGVDYLNGKPVSYSDFYSHYPICHQATFTRKRAFEEIGDYNISYKLAADTEWFVRFFKNRADRALYLDRIISFYDVPGTSYHKRMQGYREYIRFSAAHFPFLWALKIRLFYPLIWLKVKFIRSFQQTAWFKRYRKLRFKNRIANS